MRGLETKMPGCKDLALRLNLNPKVFRGPEGPRFHRQNRGAFAHPPIADAGGTHMGR